MRSRSTVVVTVFLIAFASRTQADWFHDFNNGQIPDSFEISIPPVFPQSSTWSADASEGYLRLSESRSPALEPPGTPVLVALETSEMFKDVRVSGTVNLDPSLGTFLGLQANNIGLGSYLFSLEIAPSADEGTAWLAQTGMNGITQWGSKRDFGIPTTLDVNESYYLEFDVVRDQLTGRVYDAPGGTELINITQTAPNPFTEPGFAGVYTDTAVGFEHVPTGGTFDNVAAVALPVTPQPPRFIFSEPENVLSVSSNRWENFPHLSNDGLTMYFGGDSPELNGELPEIYMATRTSLDEPFGQRTRVGGTPAKVNFLGSLSNGELALYYSTFVPGSTEQTAHVVTRDSTEEMFDFGGSKPLAEINSVGSVIDPGHVSNDGLSIFFTVGGGGPDSGVVAGAYVATRENTDEPFGEPVQLAEVGAVDYVTEDALVLFSVSETNDLLISQRSSTDEAFPTAVSVGPVINSDFVEQSVFFHEASSTLYFGSDRPGTTVPQFGPPPAPVRDIWQSKVSIAGDFDFDHTFSAADIDLLAEAIRVGQYHYNLDTNQDGEVDVEDHQLWIEGAEFANTFLGDTDLNGTVDFADFLSLSENFGKSGGWGQGDFDGSGTVGFADFLALSANFDRTNVAAVVVPEPIGCASFAMVTMFVCLSRRSRRSSRKLIPRMVASAASR